MMSFQTFLSQCCTLIKRILDAKLITTRNTQQAALKKVSLPNADTKFNKATYQAADYPNMCYTFTG